MNLFRRKKKKEPTVKMRPPEEGADMVANEVLDANNAEAAQLQARSQNASIAEILEYVKGLGIDPVAEPEMVWVAEEAMDSPLPPNWTEHQDERGSHYFYNSVTKESCWRHPMDEVFRDIVAWQRRAVRDQGFWNVDYDIGQTEESLREDLQHWMELYDEKGEKFYYNRVTEDSTFDDPRLGAYHKLYARIRLLATLKERMPVEAAAERPPGVALELPERRLAGADADLVRSAIKIQSLVRVMIARRRVQEERRTQIVLNKPQPLRGQVQLRLQKLGPGGTRELVLSQTTARRRHNAAVKMQAIARGRQARKLVRGYILHRQNLGKILTRIQAMARIWLARQRCKRVRQERREKAARHIQKCARGYLDRGLVFMLKSEKRRFMWMIACASRIQATFRMIWTWRVQYPRILQQRSEKTLILQKFAKAFLARRLIMRQAVMEGNIQASVVMTVDPHAATIMPWTLQVLAAPWFEHPAVARERIEAKIQARAAASAAAEAEEAKAGLTPEDDPEVLLRRKADHAEMAALEKELFVVANAKPGGWANMFKKMAPDRYEHHAAIRMQAVGRGMLSRRRVRELRIVSTYIIDTCIDAAVRESQVRDETIVKLQANYRGTLIRKATLINDKTMAFFERHDAQLARLQACARQYSEQGWLHDGIEFIHRTRASIVIQARWRGFLAKRHAEVLRMESLWPLKGFIDYKTTSPETLDVEFICRPNPYFDAYSYFLKHGGPDMDVFLHNMETGVKGCTESYEDMCTKKQRRGSHPEADTPGLTSAAPPPPDAKAKAAPKAKTKAEPKPKERRAGAEPTKPRRASAESVKAQPENRASTAGSTQSKGQIESRIATPNEPASPVSQTRPESKDSKAAAKKKAKKSSQAEATETASGEAQTRNSSQAPDASLADNFGDQSELEAVPTTETPTADHVEAGDAAEESAEPTSAVQEDEQDADEEDEVKEGEDKNETTIKFVPKKRPARAMPLATAMLRNAPRRYRDLKERTIPQDASQSLEPPAETQAQEEKPVTAEPAAPHAPASEKKGKSYAGNWVGGRFVKNFLSLDSMSAASKQAILNDIDLLQRSKDLEMKLKRKELEQQKKEAARAKVEKLKSQNATAEAIKLERCANKADDMARWLEAKAAESKAKRDRDKAMMREIQEREAQKAESAKKLEEDRVAERERRLRIAENIKKREEEKMAEAKAARAARKAAPASPPIAAGKGAPLQADRSVLAPALDTAPPQSQRDMRAGRYTVEYPSEDVRTDSLEDVPSGASRLLHRHVHHHVHYHDGAPDESVDPSTAQVGEGERRRLEAASEARVRMQLDAQPAASAGYPSGYPEASQMGRAASFAALLPQRRAQDLSRKSSLPQLDPSTRSCLVHYIKSVEQAHISYADTRRPTFV